MTSKPSNFWFSQIRSTHLLIFFVANLFLLTSCATGGRTINISVKRPALVTVADGKATQLKADEKFILSDRPVSIESPGHVGVMLVPLGKDATDIQVSLRPITEWPGREFEERANEIASEVVAKVVELQIKVASGKGKEILPELDALQEKYPRVSYLKFMKVSALIIQGRKDDATSTLEEALREFPDNALGKTLYKELTGKEFSGVKSPP